MSRIALFASLLSTTIAFADMQTKPSPAPDSKCTSQSNFRNISISQTSDMPQPERPTVTEIRTSGPLENPPLPPELGTNESNDPPKIPPLAPPIRTPDDDPSDAQPKTLPLPFYPAQPSDSVPQEIPVPKSVIKPVEFENNANKAKGYAPDQPNTKEESLKPGDLLPPNSPTEPPALAPKPLQVSPQKTHSPWVIRVEVVESGTQLVASSKNAEFKVKCQHLHVQSPAGDIQAEGNVQVTVLGLKMECQKMIISWQDDWVALEGDVRLSTQKSDQRMDLAGEKLRLKLTRLISTSSLNKIGPILRKAGYVPPVSPVTTPANELPQARPVAGPYYQRVTKD